MEDQEFKAGKFYWRIERSSGTATMMQIIDRRGVLHARMIGMSADTPLDSLPVAHYYHEQCQEPSIARVLGCSRDERMAQLKEMNIAKLGNIARELGIDPERHKKLPPLYAAILKAEGFTNSKKKPKEETEDPLRGYPN